MHPLWSGQVQRSRLGLLRQCSAATLAATTPTLAATAVALAATAVAQPAAALALAATALAQPAAAVAASRRPPPAANVRGARHHYQC